MPVAPKLCGARTATGLGPDPRAHRRRTGTSWWPWGCDRQPVSPQHPHPDLVISSVERSADPVVAVTDVIPTVVSMDERIINGLSWLSGNGAHLGRIEVVLRGDNLVGSHTRTSADFSKLLFGKRDRHVLSLGGPCRLTWATYAGPDVVYDRGTCDTTGGILFSVWFRGRRRHHGSHGDAFTGRREAKSRDQVLEPTTGRCCRGDTADTPRERQSVAGTKTRS